MSRAARQMYLATCAALWGLGIAIALYPYWIRPAAPGQLPSYLTSKNIDSHASFHLLASVVVIPLIVVFILRPVIARLADSGTRRWARNAAGIAMMVGLWHAIEIRNLPWTVIPPALALIAITLARRVDARFSRRDVLLLPAFGAVYIVLCDVTHLGFERITILSAGAVLALRVALSWRGWRRPALCFALAPIALAVPQPIVSMIIAIGSPIALRFLVRDTPKGRRILAAVIAFVSYPIAAYSYAAGTSLLRAEHFPRAALYQDALHMTPANELSRGERPYRDVVPIHGLIEDALLDAAILKSGAQTVGDVMRARLHIGELTPVLSYAITAVATGSSDAGFVGFTVASLLGYQMRTTRFIPMMAVVALLCAAARTRNRKLIAWAAAVSVIAGLTSIDFGVYCTLLLIVTILRFEDRKRALVPAAIGAAVVAIPAMLAMLIAGFLGDFFRVSIFEVVALTPAYALEPVARVAALSGFFPDFVASIFDSDARLYLFWIAALIGIATVIGCGLRRSDRRRRAIEPLIVIALWMVILGISYAERHHLYFDIAIPPLLVASAFRLFRERNVYARVAAWAIAAILAISANLTAHLFIVQQVRRSTGPLENGFVQVESVARARGAWFQAGEVQVIDSVARWSAAKLKPGETWFDFTNRGLLYFLFDRDMPVRQIEIPFAEREDLQREVIRRLERNSHVVAALVAMPGQDTNIDGIRNGERAPLIRQYLETYFRPDYDDGHVVIWRRK
jgi:hypothetical protein